MKLLERKDLFGTWKSENFSQCSNVGNDYMLVFSSNASCYVEEKGVIILYGEITIDNITNPQSNYITYEHSNGVAFEKIEVIQVMENSEPVSMMVKIDGKTIYFKR